ADAHPRDPEPLAARVPVLVPVRGGRDLPRVDRHVPLGLLVVGRPVRAADRRVRLHDVLPRGGVGLRPARHARPAADRRRDRRRRPGRLVRTGGLAVRRALLIALLAALLLPTAASAMRNPVVPETAAGDDTPDPWLFRHADRYWLTYTTAGRIELRSARTLTG